MDELLKNPLWQAQDLGKPLPNSRHAVSVCLPTWADVVGYEEKDERVLSKLQLGYPRFVIHPLVRELNQLLRSKLGLEKYKQDCLIMPSEASAQRAKEFLKKRFGIQSQNEIIKSNIFDLNVFIFPDTAFNEAKQYWQHSGEIISSRQAEFILKVLRNPNSDQIKDCKQELRDIEYKGKLVKQNIKERISISAQVNSKDIYLFQSGMAAIYLAYLIANNLERQNNNSSDSLNTPSRTVQFGFPYTDTLKIQEKFNFQFNPNTKGVCFFPKGDLHDLERLEELLQTEQISALFCEFPSNPLLQSVDLKELKKLSKKHSFPIIVDDTIGSFQNIDLREYADIIVTSLTKFFSGESDCTAGSLILCERSPFYETLSRALEDLYQDNLWTEDAIILENNSRSFAERMNKINKSAETLCDFLERHPKVHKVYYPKFIDTYNYKELQSSHLGAGFGGLFSLELVNPETNAPIFYDNLRICKGPSLGTNFTIACPYTLLAHYDELDFVEECGVSRYLIRFSVGLEEAKELIVRFSEAFSKL
ncbi:MAG: PLP-dependent transferase [Candidatus Caenarcaniphilales bacterium]|nr:PLP-dependent transferase [Candidatus Caenarcaniphilales bacterium]